MAPTATGATPTAAAAASAAAPAASSASTTGAAAPTSLEEATQRYQSTKLALRTGLANKRIIDRSLIDLESQIYLFEGSYLHSTSTSGGNIVKGFDSYLKNSSSSSGGGRGSNANNAAGADIPLEDRIFSLSSATYQKSLELKANEGLQEEEADRESSAANTPKASKKDKALDDDATPAVKKSKKDKETDKGSSVGKERSVVKKKGEKERSSTPNLKSTGGGKNATDGGGSAGGTPTKAGGTGGKAMGTGTKLKRKNTDVAGTGGKAQKRKKEDD